MRANVFGIDFDPFDQGTLIDELIKRAKDGRPSYVLTTNFHHVLLLRHDVELRLAFTDAAAITAMIHGLADFERAADQCTVNEKQISTALFNERPTLRAHVAEVDGEVAGYVNPGDALEIDARPAAARVVRLGRTTFYQRARRKLRIADSADTMRRNRGRRAARARWLRPGLSRVPPTILWDTSHDPTYFA